MTPQEALEHINAVLQLPDDMLTETNRSHMRSVQLKLNRLVNPPAYKLKQMAKEKRLDPNYVPKYDKNQVQQLPYMGPREEKARRTQL